MHIVECHSYYPPYMGGVERVIFNLSENFIKFEHECSIICFNHENKNKFKEEIINGVKIYRLPYAFKIGNTPVSPKYFSFLKKFLKEHDVDVIHTHMPTPFTSDISIYLAKRYNISSCLTYHCDVDIGSLMHNIIGRTYELSLLRRTLNSVDIIVALTRKYVNKISYVLPNYKNKVKIIPNGIATTLFNPYIPYKDLEEKMGIKNKPKLLFVGLLDQYHRYKGLDVLINAMKIVKKEIPSTVLIIVGSGVLREEYEKLAKELDLSKNIVFTGRISDNDLLKYYAMSDLFILPSLTKAESFPIVSLEAMSSGVPIITTPVSGLTDIITNRKEGLFVKTRDTNSLADAIISLLEGGELRSEMSRNARDLTIKHYDWNIVAKRYLDIFNFKNSKR